MTADEFKEARRQAGMSVVEFGRALRFNHDPGRTVRKYEDGQRPISGPLSVAVEAIAAGFRPS